MNAASRIALVKSESESRWLSNSNGNDENNKRINEEDYEIDSNDCNDEDLVKDLD